MKIPKPSDDHRAYFKSIVPDASGVETKPMFGNLAAFVNGNMFMDCSAPRSVSVLPRPTAINWRPSRVPARSARRSAR